MYPMTVKPQPTDGRETMAETQGLLCSWPPVLCQNCSSQVDIVHDSIYQFQEGLLEIMPLEEFLL